MQEKKEEEEEEEEEGEVMCIMWDEKEGQLEAWKALKRRLC